MANQTHEPQTQVSSAGLDFDYTVWTPGTTAHMANVPWDAMYRDVVAFGDGPDYVDEKLLDEYIIKNSGPAFTFEKLTLAKPGVPVRIPLPFNVAWQFNYLRVRNPGVMGTPDIPRTFYYFINDVKYLAPNTTELHIQLDVWATFGRVVTIGNAYVERGHIGIANENQFSKYGREYLTVPEGFDIGNEYQVVDAKAYMLCQTKVNESIDSQYMGKPYDIVVTSTVSLTSDPGTVNAPKLLTASGSNMEGLPNGCEIYVFTANQFDKMTTELKNYPWIAQGIISITACPPIPGKRTDVAMFGNPAIVGAQMEGNRIPHMQHEVYTNFRDGFRIHPRYVFLKKFLTYPYTLVEMTTYSGNPIILKPECINYPHVSAIKMMHVGPPSPRISFYPFRYNAAYDDSWYGLNETTGGTREVWSDYGAEFLDMQCGIFDLPQFSLTNSGYLQYMAANRNSIAYGYSSADWSQQRALAGNQLSFDQASSGMQLSQNLTGMQIGAMNASTDLANFTAVGRGAASIGTAMAGGLMGGGIAGALLGAAGTAANTGLTVNQQTQQNSINTGLTRAQNDANVSNMGYMRDSNKQFADWAARGDYANTIAGLNAKVQDAKMIQPTTSGQIGGDAFNLSTIGWGIHVKLKRIEPSAMRAIGDFWLRYGYAVNRWVQVGASLHCMSHFTYWKLKETYLTSAICPEYYRGVIRGIFEKGVTVWKNPDDIGTMDPVWNTPVKGIVI